jgi:hypothetical protein
VSEVAVEAWVPDVNPTFQVLQEVEPEVVKAAVPYPGKYDCKLCWPDECINSPARQKEKDPLNF